MPASIQSQIIANSPLPQTVEAILRRIPLFAAEPVLHIATLRDVISLNNQNYRVTAGDTDYFLRVAAESGHYLGIRRVEEIEAAKSAAAVGVAPPILYDEPAGHLLMPFIRGRHWVPDDFHQPENLRRILRAFQRMHRVQDLQSDGSAYRRIERLLESATALNLELPPNLPDCRKRLKEIEHMRQEDSRYAPGLSHNDFWANNFLDDGETLWLFDWEFGGKGDGLYDLATASLAGSLSPEEEIFLLRNYGYDRPDDIQILDAMKFVARFFEASWGLVQHGLRGSAVFDYQNYALKMFERM